MNTIKQLGYLLAGCAVTLSVYSCGNGSSSTSTSDSTSMTSKIDTVMQNAKNAVDTGIKDVKQAFQGNVDSNFVCDVYAANWGEINMLQNGIDKGTDATLKKDAKHMIADHKKLSEWLKDYASKNNYVLPTSADDMGDISANTGKDWDKAWADKMVDGHKKTIDKFESNQDKVKNPDLKAKIVATLPTLHMHLDMVQQLDDKLK